MNEIGFERISHFVALSSIGKENRSTLFNHFYLKEQDVKIKFSDYVRSQIHLDLITPWFGRELKDYAHTYRCIKEGMLLEDLPKNVLHYFYLDMAKAMINNTNRLKILACVDVESGSYEYYDYNEVRKSLEIIIREDDAEKIETLLKSCKYNEVFDYMDDKAEYYGKEDNWVLASILLYHSSLDSMSNLKIGGLDEIYS